MTTESTESDQSGWDYQPHTGPHRFRPWTVMHNADGTHWLAPGCTCGTIRAAGKPTESEYAMRLWWETHASAAGHVNPTGVTTSDERP